MKPSSFTTDIAFSKYDIIKSFVTIKEKFGKNYLDQIYDLIFLSILNHQFSFSEYQELMPVGGAKFEEMRYFIGQRQITRMHILQNRDSSTQSIEILKDKFLFDQIMHNVDSSIDLAEIQFLFQCRGFIASPNAIKSKDELLDTIRSKVKFPIFCKPKSGKKSFGAVSIISYDSASDELVLLDETRINCKSFVDDVFAFYKDGYLIQSRINQHPDVEILSGNTVSTIRFVTFHAANEIEVAYAFWKVAAPKAMADNSWRPGAVLVALDPITGNGIRAQVGFGPNARLVKNHEATGRPLVGVPPPLWDAARALALKASAIFSDVNVLAWDIALGVNGPVIVEGNTGPGHILYQRAFGRGVLSTPLGPMWERMRKEAEAAPRQRSKRPISLFKRLANRSVSLFAAR